MMKFLVVSLATASIVSAAVLAFSWLDGDSMALCQAKGHSYETCLTEIGGK